MDEKTESRMQIRSQHSFFGSFICIHTDTPQHHVPKIAIPTLNYKNVAYQHLQLPTLNDELVLIVFHQEVQMKISLWLILAFFNNV